VTWLVTYKVITDDCRLTSKAAADDAQRASKNGK
jgi:hypothetical protein